MLTKIKERTEDAPLRVELQGGEADFRILAEAIASRVFISLVQDSVKGGMYVFTRMDFHRGGRWMGSRKSSSG